MEAGWVLLMKSKKITIKNDAGLDIRPARIIANAAEQCTSRVELIAGNNTVNCRSILNILSVAIRKGAVVELCCTGEREEQDLEYRLRVIEDELIK